LSSSNVLESNRMQKLFKGCGTRWCGPTTARTYPKK
jgi:hypothetical protein